MKIREQSLSFKLWIFSRDFNESTQNSFK